MSDTQYTVNLIGRNGNGPPFGCREIAATPTDARTQAAERYPNAIIDIIEWVEDGKYQGVEFNPAGDIIARFSD